MTRTLAATLLMACAIVGAATLISRRLQPRASTIVWDARQYYRVTRDFVAGDRPYAESPYVFRIGLPCLVAALAPADPRSGFLAVNVVCAFAIGVLLAVWLTEWGIGRSLCLGAVALFAAAWHGPARYVYYNPAYVDPPFIAFLIAGLLLIRSIDRRYSASGVVALTLLVAAGTLVRETMVLVAASFVLVSNPVRHWLNGSRTGNAIPVAARFAPLVAGFAGLLLTHAVVTVDVSERSSMVGAALQWLHKAPDSYVMGWLTAFGPVAAIVLFDWRRALAFLAEHEWLVGFFLLCVALSFFGGSDTERFAFWSMPVVYLLLARAVERHLPALRRGVLPAAIIVAQAVAARVFWGIPDPQDEAVVSLANSPGLAVRAYGIVNRLIVIDAFHWNLWSTFGSRPLRLLRIALYAAVMAAIIWTLRRRERALAHGLASRV